MADSAVLKIRRSFKRASTEDIGRFTSAPTGWVVDANSRRGALSYRIRPITKAVRSVGSALTVRSRARDNLAPYVALKYAQPGDILVIAADGYEEASVLGDVLLGMAKNAGVVAVVTDGMVRDIAGLDAVGIPVFALGLTPNSPHKDGPGEIGTDISVGGVTVCSGDIVITDQDGVVVVPYSQRHRVGTALADVATKEAAMDAAVRDGAKRPTWVDTFVEGPKVEYVD